MITKGFKFGLLLQFAIGPVCIFIFDTARQKGIINAELGVIAVVLVDAFYILLAILGITAFLQSTKVKKFFKVFGVVILTYFGIATILGSMGYRIIPNIGIETQTIVENPFIKGLILTISSPLTILFWAGVFSSKTVEEKLIKKDLYGFGLGAVLSTLIFLSCISFVGSILRPFLHPLMVNLLNVIVGISFLIFAVRLAIKKI
jgi:threonine/homoserine/homoserine lactone efflux protein